ncbi:putative polynucleotide adenylyltransferase [Helianthus annuus]|nr:putative polynucleotide adenylyltransferase [Helianthus annuus]
MAAVSVKRNYVVSRFKPLLSSQCLYHKLAEAGNKPRPRSSEKDSPFQLGELNIISKWQKMDSRSLGITRKVPSSPYTLIKILRSRGFEAYLVGGCVRDLLLNRTPKDFDVITTADLDQIKKQFHRCMIVGRRFPICMVHIKGSVIEVSSFKTLAKHSENKEKFLVSQMPRGCDKSDLNLWKNSMHRDFTVNSLFFDPIIHKIYDYNNGMKDLLDLKLRTLVPAHESFTEDCARILRGLRLAARLGLSFSKDIESAIHKHASSILTLSAPRIMMEMNYMLSFGAAESSLRLLHRYHILEILLPFQAAYFSRQTTGSGQHTVMLMKLFSHLDKFVSCDKPSAPSLWIGLLAFHQALLDKPQHPFVVLTFGSVLYHQSWEDGLMFARKYVQPLVNFDPETLDPYTPLSDDEVAEKVKELAMRVIDSIDILVDADVLNNTMSKFPCSPCSGLVFISKNAAHGTAQLFHVLSHKVVPPSKGRSSFEMNHQLLGKGDPSETRFALGKIIMNTMGCGIDNQPALPESVHVTPPELNAKSSSSKKQNAATEKPIKEIADSDHAIEKPEEICVSKSPIQELMATLESIIEDEEDLPSQLEGQNANEKVNSPADVQVDQSITKEQSVDKKDKRKPVLQLSSLFK